LKRTIQQLSDIFLPASVWTELPEYVFAPVVEHLQGNRKVSANFRHVCHAWHHGHDRLITVLKPKRAPPDKSVWKKFGGVKVVDLKNSTMSADDIRALAPLTALTNLDLHNCSKVTDEGVMALALAASPAHRSH
jgi:hypothetical protein